ncbi:MAG: hypothetical protein K0B87_09270 [Candidatus Syntrophosphaera sp.]|nr:hypothetical protein [Candidatus Syntrophosphaera sp.]
MRYALLLAMAFFALGCNAFGCEPFGPQVEGLICANLDSDPLSIGGMEDTHGTVYLFEGDVWNSYPHYSNLPVLDLCQRDYDTLLAIMGAGSYSDGVYKFDLGTHVWTINHWFYWPKFIRYCPANGYYYVGEQLGLFRSPDGLNWYGTPGLGEGPCTSLAFYGDHFVANRSNGVYYSADAGQTWQASSMVMLR